LRTSLQVEAEIAKVHRLAAQNYPGKMPISIFLTYRKLRRRLIGLSILMTAHQLCGINVVSKK